MNESTRGLSADAIAGLLAETSPYLSCDDCFARMDEYVERRLAEPSYDERAMSVHLSGCGVCAEEAATLRDLLVRDAG